MNLNAFLNPIYLNSKNQPFTVAMCLGYRFGTGCKHHSRCTQKRVNWEKWQLCMRCARRLHPEFYKNKKNHGVKTFEDPDKIPKQFMVTKVPLTSHEIRNLQKEKVLIESKELA